MMSNSRNDRRSGVPAMACCALLLAGLSVETVVAVPVIPGAAGFGLETAAGRGGTVYRVTNLNERGGGSLGACVAATGPRICIFEISGTIRLGEELVVRNDRLTIAGQTAPSPGILLRGAGLRIQASDILVQHLRIRPGDDAAGPDAVNRDALKIEGSAERPVRNVVVDHCSFSWSVDEVASAWQHWDNVSLLNNIFAEPLDDSIHPEAGTPGDGLGHGYGILFGSNDGSVAMIGNLLAHQAERNPLSQAARFVFVNNVVYNRANMDIELQSSNGRVTANAIVGNVFIRGGDYALERRPVYVRTDGSLGLLPGSRVHVKDNVSQETNGDAWSVVGLQNGSMLRANLEAAEPPTWPTGLVARATANDAVLERVLTTAGARPADRDAADRRVVQSVRDRNGQIVNCVSADGSARCNRNAGGWPSLPLRRRALLLPLNPKSLDASGYTNLEIWLHTMNGNVEGAPPVKGPKAPTEVRAQ